jgi:integrase
MKQQFKLYRRSNGNYYAEDVETGKQSSLRTSEKIEADRLLHAKNEAAYQPAFNTQIARAYLVAGDPGISKRTWQFAMDALKQSKERSTVENTCDRYESAFNESAFDSIRSVVIVETRPETILKVIHSGTVSTNIFMRRLHSFALGMGWLPWPIISYKQWPRIRFQPRRAIKADEAAKLIAVEKDAEWKAFLQLLWHIGAAQVDLAALTDENVDWKNRTISYNRKKTGSLAIQRFGSELEAILKERPSSGPLFPHFSKISSADRATRFSKRCKKVGIVGVSLHSYRYAWAERALELGFPERFAQAALGHNSAAVHRAYAKGAKVNVPSLEEYEKRTPCPPESTAPQIDNADAQTNILPFPASNPTETTVNPIEPGAMKAIETKEAV